MILVFIKGIANGDCKIAGYDNWFVVDSVSFGISHIDLKKQKDDLGTGIRIEAGKEEKGQEVTIDKTVDSVTCDLMQQAMKHRYARVGDKNQLLEADIHFVETYDQKPKAYMLIHLEDVLVKSWGINASGDDRPGESIGLWCDKVAINYMTQAKGGLIQKGPRGWDQGDTNKAWTPNTKYFPSGGKFPP